MMTRDEMVARRLSNARAFDVAAKACGCPVRAAHLQRCAEYCRKLAKLNGMEPAAMLAAIAKGEMA